MTPEELAEVEERCRKATAGPWEAERAVDLAGFEQNDLWIIMRGQPCAYRFDRTEDAEFCAHARADVPALVAEVRRLREIKCDKIDCARLEADRIEACRRAEKAEAEVARLREALDAAGKLVKRYNVKTDDCRECGVNERCEAHR